MVNHCSMCGAILASGESCRSRFDSILGIEFGDPAFFAVHHFSVTAYMLQHNEYSRAGWLAAVRLLERFLADSMDQAEVRRVVESDLLGRSGNWTKGERLQGVDEIEWRLSVADIRTDTAEHYCDDVLKWAEAVVTDAKKRFGDLSRLR